MFLKITLGKLLRAFVWEGGGKVWLLRHCLFFIDTWLLRHAFIVHYLSRMNYLFIHFYDKYSCPTSLIKIALSIFYV